MGSVSLCRNASVVVGEVRNPTSPSGEREGVLFYASEARVWASSEGGMSLRLRGESKVQASRPSIYLFYSYLYRDTFVSKALNIERTSR